VWKPTEVGEVIAEREFDFAAPDGATHPVILRLGRPVHAGVEGDPWWCPFSITGIGSQRFFAAAGEDALQAMLLTLQAVRADLDAMARDAGGKITWLGLGELGLPDDPPRRLLDQLGVALRALNDARSVLREGVRDEDRVRAALDGIDRVLDADHGEGEAGG